jgi:GNAT superfamily N-acetyltransferase
MRHGTASESCPAGMSDFRIRLATAGDLPAFRELIPESVRKLSAAHYSPAQIESAITHVFGPDTRLIRDGTYYAVEANGRVVGCGGWSKRLTIYGGDQMAAREDPLLDPQKDAARIRAFFIDPAFSRRGIGRALLEVCAGAALQAGFERLELVATLPGEQLYKTCGFEVMERIPTVLPDGVKIEFVRMGRAARWITESPRNA